MFKILSLDGGGIRGLMTAYWLQALEERLGGELHTKFSMVAGTSTGSIVACAIGLKKPVAQIIDLYRSLGPEIFPIKQRGTFEPGLWQRLWLKVQLLLERSAPTYDGIGFEKVLREATGAAGADVRFGDLALPTLAPAYDTNERRAIVLKSWDPRFADLPVWQVCRSSGAAPTYFPAQVVNLGDEEIPLVDGAIVANDPALCGIAAALARGEMLHEIVVVSLGTGESGDAILASEATVWGQLQWGLPYVARPNPPIVDILFDGSADAVEYIVRHLLTPERYFRFQTKLPAVLAPMDKVDTDHLAGLEKSARDFLATPEGKKLLDDAVAALA